jgi:TolB protein
MAAADFKPVGGDPQTPALKAAFDATLYSDLANAGIFDLVSKSMIPQATPGSPKEINLAQWSAAPANAAMVAFGALSANNGRLIVYGWLDDAATPSARRCWASSTTKQASQDSARTVAHRFADEIILRLGGGINGIAETKIYFVSSRTGSKEIWAMDYDGQNQHQITHLGSISLSPRISPDNSRIAFASLGREGWSIRMYSLDLGRMVSFPAGTAGEAISRRPGRATAPRSPSPRRARAIRRSGWPTPAAAILRKLTSFRGPDVRPPGIRAPTRNWPGSAGAPGCRRSTPWIRTAPTSSA